MYIYFLTDLVRRSVIEVHETTRTILELSGFCFETNRKVRITETNTQSHHRVKAIHTYLNMR